VPDPFELHPIRVDDAEEMAENVRLGFESYRSWTRRGWDPPPRDMEAAHIAEKLREVDIWGRVALAGGAHAGHVAMTPARTREEPRTPIEGLAHLWQLFVRPPWWGSGLATRLLALAVDAAAERGYPEMRLFTPAGNARGRAFYEREGWRVHSDAAYEPMLGLDLLEYRRDLR